MKPGQCHIFPTTLELIGNILIRLRNCRSTHFVYVPLQNGVSAQVKCVIVNSISDYFLNNNKEQRPVIYTNGKM